MIPTISIYNNKLIIQYYSCCIKYRNLFYSFINSHMDKRNKLFLEIKKVLENNSENFSITEKYINSKAKIEKPQYHLYGNKEVSIFGKKPQKTYVAGVIQQKNYVSFYFSPIYSHPESFMDISPELKKFLKGKSCFNITNINPKLLNELENLLKKGINKYKQLEWV